MYSFLEKQICLPENDQRSETDHPRSRLTPNNPGPGPGNTQKQPLRCFMWDKQDLCLQSVRSSLYAMVLAVATSSALFAINSCTFFRVTDVAMYFS